ncbi:hypothetical protein BVRB_033120 [Beta vulgaris subsp. vulgaris]|uniref:Uncharacterized protein n=1 Tax=Beta vulgaris subsp. vulgaris TaxID=3555 RepID=A0A0J8DRC1_BETVV|nr:hypothetical protein BVRB_033120 [Beta vulgaris subsp. vulgaris]
MFLKSYRLNRISLSELSLIDKVAVLRDTLSEAGVESSDTDQTSCVSSKPSPIIDMNMIETIGGTSGTRKRKQALDDDFLQLNESKTKRSSITSCASEKSFDDFDAFRPKQ